MLKYHIIQAIILIFFLATQALAAPSITYKEVRIPVPGAGGSGLEALLVWPNDSKSHPTALISHGSPRDGSKRAIMSAISSLPMAMEFARRGFATAYVLRRGYGSSGGGWAESTGSCTQPDYLKSAAAASKDLHAIVAYLGTLPAFDTHKILAVGVSAGGFSTVAFSADQPPKGLVAAISFAGGRGSKASNVVCQPDKLVDAFGVFGKTSRIPMLWVYAQNDNFFNPQLAKRFYNAFTQSGGHATLLMVPAYGDEGHFLFSNAGIPEWTPILDDFLKKQQLVQVNTLLPLPSTPSLKTPRNLSVQGKSDFVKYTKAPPHKAFAITESGAYGWRSGQRTIEEAEQQAVENCEKHTSKQCEVISKM